jgi:N-dimethylarginine dimethylaminohydrolase
MFGALNEYGALKRVVLRSPADLFRADVIARDWRALNFSAPPDPALASEQYERFQELVATSGAHIDLLPHDATLTLDAIYVRDASIVTPQGMVLCAMGKPARAHEPTAQRPGLVAAGVKVIGTVQPPAKIEGGDVVWFDARTVAVAHGYRTNGYGTYQLRRLLGDDIDMVVVPLPHYRGPADVFHLMSIISPIDRDLAVVYSPLMPVPFREWLCSRGLRLVEVPDEEFESMGANVLALAPRRCLMLDGNPVTRARLESAGVDVLTYDGSEISVKGGGGPTCLTRPLVRA